VLAIGDGPVGGAAPADCLDKASVDAALAGDAAAVRDLVEALAPVVQGRVVRTLLRRRPRGMADLTTTVEDLVQDTFVALLQDGARMLRTWNPERGLRLESFAALVAEQRVLATLRSRRKNPFAEELAIDDGDLEVAEEATLSPEARATSRQELRDLLDEVRSRLSPMGMELFMALVVREESIADVCARTRLSTSAVQAWSSRLKRLVQQLGAARAGRQRGTEAGSAEVGSAEVGSAEVGSAEGRSEP
jgi:RNA polymerase sigma-70 factor (ECF subfamily)